MAIHFVSGKPGAGKTLYAVRLIVHELAFGCRHVYTNVALKVGELSEYLAKEYPHKLVDVVNRVWIMDEEQTAHFWTFRPGVRIPELNKLQWRDGQTPSYAEVKDSGVFYVLDEVHIMFGSRQWAETGRDVLFYLSQHRKLGDTVIAVTQSVPNVDRQFRSLSQDFTYIRNLNKEKLWLFRLPALFLRRTYNSPPAESGTTPALETGSFRLDVSGLASCYNTAAGVGIHALVGDKGERRRGLAWYWGAAIAAAVILLIGFQGPKAVASLFKNPVGQVAKGGAAVSTVIPATVSNSVPAPARAVVSIGAEPVRGGVGRAGVFEVGTNSPVYMTGFAVYSGRMFVTLSDGRTYWGGGMVRVVADETGARIGNEFYPAEPPAATKERFYGRAPGRVAWH